MPVHRVNNVTHKARLTPIGTRTEQRSGNFNYVISLAIACRPLPAPKDPWTLPANYVSDFFSDSFGLQRLCFPPLGAHHLPQKQSPEGQPDQMYQRGDTGRTSSQKRLQLLTPVSLSSPPAASTDFSPRPQASSPPRFTLTRENLQRWESSTHAASRLPLTSNTLMATPSECRDSSPTRATAAKINPETPLNAYGITTNGKNTIPSALQTRWSRQRGKQPRRRRRGPRRSSRGRAGWTRRPLLICFAWAECSPSLYTLATLYLVGSCTLSPLETRTGAVQGNFFET
ncbi:hypothetical protein BCR34DRAFT_594161 [Clohesyomyces aquaticus]|uniref:Uncharacterized protein n=1 Tax=Clohesyomyces aquaticus TaxID=1231657 RepID=A0A1Y1YBL2_9PLEO|nr:hypothetical protein BCR34DRAFT_594161 [Clohesyomyces aquaticus]